MYLNPFFLYRRNIKGTEAVYQRHRNDRASCFDSALEGSGLKVKDLIAFAASGAFGEDYKISSLLYLGGHLFDDLHGGADIGPVHGNAFQETNYLFYQDPLGRLFFMTTPRGLGQLSMIASMSNSP